MADLDALIAEWERTSDGLGTEPPEHGYLSQAGEARVKAAGDALASALRAAVGREQQLREALEGLMEIASIYGKALRMKAAQAGSSS